MTWFLFDLLPIRNFQNVFISTNLFKYFMVQLPFFSRTEIHRLLTHIYRSWIFYFGFDVLWLLNISSRLVIRLICIWISLSTCYKLITYVNFPKKNIGKSVMYANSAFYWPGWNKFSIIPPQPINSGHPSYALFINVPLVVLFLINF